MCLVVLYILYAQFTQKKTEFADQLTLADVVESKNSINELSEEDKLLQAID